MKLRVLFLLSFFACPESFAPTMRRDSTLHRLHASNEKRKQTSYNDDAFGLVFLTPAAVGHDEIFVASFTVLSAIAASLVTSKKADFEPRLPGIVAASSFFLTVTLSKGFGVPSGATLDARSIEGLTCLISIAWCVWQEYCSPTGVEKP